MKRTVITLLAFALFMTGASAQVTKRLNRLEVTFADTLKLDSLYNFWNAYVQLHPKDEMAWRNLFDASEGKVHDMIYRTRDWDGCERYRKQLNVVGRMKKAIPDSYTFYYCAHEGSYLPEAEEKQYRENGAMTLFAHYDAYADSAIARLPDDAYADDYETWIPYLIEECDSVRLKNILTRYYESGQYPEEDLQYHFNELQGMDEGGVYIGVHDGDIIGKLILQQVLGVHKDKIVFHENAAMHPWQVRRLFGKIGIPFNEEVWGLLHMAEQEQQLLKFLRYIVDNSKRPVYLSAHNMWGLIIGKGLPDELKACFYNEGLTMRYSTRPYDNRSVKRRNIEKRYRLEYLRMPFHPKRKEDRRRFANVPEAYAIDYVRLLHDQLPYYKQHNKERYQWLRDIFTDIIKPLEKENNYVVDELKGYLK